MTTLAFRWIGLGEARAHPGRILLAVLAIAIGVGLGFAVHLVNASALNEFAHAVQAVNGDADLQVHSVTPNGFDEKLYPKLARAAGVFDASPVIEFAAHSGDVPLTLLGIDVFRAASVTPALVGRAGESGGFGSGEAIAADSVFLSRAALAALRKRIGNDITIEAGGKNATLRNRGHTARNFQR